MGGGGSRPVRVGIVAIPEAGLATLSGIFDVLNSLAWLSGNEGIPADTPFQVEVLGEADGPVRLASGITLPLHGAAQDRPCDLIIVPSLFVRDSGWIPGRYPSLAGWIAERHGAGATICSACSGLFLIAETGLFDGVDATVHWPYARRFSDQYPAVRVHPDRALIVSGSRGELVRSGASTSWHDLVLYLIGREAGGVGRAPDVVDVLGDGVFHTVRPQVTHHLGSEPRLRPGLFIHHREHADLARHLEQRQRVGERPSGRSAGVPGHHDGVQGLYREIGRPRPE